MCRDYYVNAWEDKKSCGTKRILVILVILHTIKISPQENDGLVLIKWKIF